ncbi:hypothetical protein [Corallococcus terminator]|uniref:Uncharacterized protein n=1 Tax=Corallococcus terminator TaxID=2316733 RepID=A0A3A8I167_9BACT|nr:hypothetical protein [Corallococcus terminator]RKG71931.1 hypothetical protein D7V88_38945 [Corallococcus terminator]
MSLSAITQRPAFRPDPATLSRLQAKPASEAQGTQTPSVHPVVKRFQTDSFEQDPEVKSTKQSTTPTTPPGAGDTAVSTESLVQAGTHGSDQVYPELSYEETKQYNDHPVGYWKSQVFEAATNAGASEEEAALLVAQAMQEGGTDFSKNGSSTNFGPFNLNKDLIQTFGGKDVPGDLNQLNGTDEKAIALNVGVALDAMRTMGANNYLHHVRGGATNYTNPEQRISDNIDVRHDDARIFARSVANNANKILAAYKEDPNSLTTDHRFASDIPHI